MSARRNLIGGIAAALATAVVLSVGSAGASASTTQHHTFSDDWQGFTAVAGDQIGTCPLFGTPLPTGIPAYDFTDVNLTDHIKSTWIPYSSDGFLWRIKSIGRVEGSIFAPDGIYTVTSGPLREDRIGDLGIWYFQGSGRVTITGPAGTLSGTAQFTDITTDFPPDMEFVFTSITSCELN
jgi:hypothetical protein